ncbi:MAG: ribosome maturation factor RimP [Rhodocyclaceae bacterium]|jgi:ribosome maturation factor RimP|nr:ribosome maturation factor RimP [Rhodocyclaceae bacterium]
MADLAGLIEQAVTGLGYELVDFETSPRARLLRVFIDRPAVPGAPAGEQTEKPGGVTVEDCSLVSHQLTRMFLVENIDYDRLEVSSPGLDRPLKKPADFERFVGHELQIKLRIPESHAGGQGASAPQRNFSGVILGLIEGRLRLKTGEAEREFALDNIEKARLVPKF